MTIIRNIRIQGCGKELCSYTNVDLSEPKTIGQHPNHPQSYCYESPLLRTVFLTATQVGETTHPQCGIKIADVSVVCSATDCPSHVNYKPLPTHPDQK